MRFQRAIEGLPDSRYPEIDERGFNHSVPAINGQPASSPVRGNAVSIAHNHTVEIQMVRENIADNATLYATSSDDSIFTVETPEQGKPCATGKKVNLTLNTQFVLGTQPAVAQLEIRYGKPDGPVIACLLVYVMPMLVVNIQPHLVAINDASKPGTAPLIQLDSIAPLVQAIWYNAGVSLNFAKAKMVTFQGSKADYLEFAEVNAVLNTHWQSGHINVYVVQELEDALGYGFSVDDYKGYGIAHPSVFLGLNDSSSGIQRTNDNLYCANDIAHEIGHFFTLRHPSDGPKDNHTWQRFDSWSMRLLMHNWNTTWRDPADTAHNGADWPEFNQFGYGNSPHGPYRGAAIPLKTINPGKRGVDGQCAAARNHIARGAARLYGA
ncbi:MAG: hypothetical protein CMI13_12595 [Oleibacter sp.]|nr:hypothetical protein [Thalassolituus sp.]